MGHKQKTVPGEDLAVETPWREFVVVCGKCSRKLGGGFGAGGEESLRGSLKGELRKRGRRREVRVVEAGCFGLCPKGGVAVAHGAAPGRLLVVPAGEAAARVLARLAPAVDEGRQATLPAMPDGADPAQGRPLDGVA